MFKTIILGGELQRKSLLYRLLVFLRGRERIEGLQDSCGLHKQMLIGGGQLLLIAAVIGAVLGVLWLIASMAIEVGLVEALITVGVIIAAVVFLIVVISAAEAWRPVKIIVEIFTWTVGILILAIGSLCIGEELARKMEWITTFLPAVRLGEGWGYLYIGHLVAGLVALILAFVGIIILIVMGMVGHELVTYAGDEVTYTRLYRWLKGRLCFRIRIVD
jgi:hypothetical protein